MKLIPRTLLIVLSLAVMPAMAFAQDDPTLGLVMATPGSVAIIWRASDNVALRPEMGFTASTATVEAAGGDAESTQWTLNPGFAVLFYTGRWDALRTYVSPRYVYSRAHSESTSPFGDTRESTGTSHAVSGSFGAEYALHGRFAVFGEVGINYSHSEADTHSSNSWNQRTAVGAIFHF
jgi:hypothetical protein